MQLHDSRDLDCLVLYWILECEMFGKSNGGDTVKYRLTM